MGTPTGAHKRTRRIVVVKIEVGKTELGFVTAARK